MKTNKNRLNILNILFYLYIILFSVIFNEIKLYLNFKIITFLFIMHFLILIPCFIISELLRGRKIAFFLLILFLLPVSLRFILPKSLLLHYEWKRLFKASAMVVQYDVHGISWKYDWKKIGNKFNEKPPISWIDFKYFKISKGFDNAIIIYSSPFRYKGKKVHIEYNTKIKKFRFVNEQNQK